MTVAGEGGYMQSKETDVCQTLVSAAGFLPLSSGFRIRNRLVQTVFVTALPQLKK